MIIWKYLNAYVVNLYWQGIQLIAQGFRGYRVKLTLIRGHSKIRVKKGQRGREMGLVI